MRKLKYYNALKRNLMAIYSWMVKQSVLQAISNLGSNSATETVLENNRTDAEPISMRAFTDKNVKQQTAIFPRNLLYSRR